MDIYAEIEKYKAMGANLLIPFTKLEPSEFHQPVIDETHLDVEAGDAYKQASKKVGGQWENLYALTYQGLNKLAVLANVQWHPYETKRTDNRQDRLYVSFQAVGGIRKSDGALLLMIGNYDMDFEVIEEELMDQYRDKVAKDEKMNRWTDQQKADYVTNMVRRDMIFKRKHRLKLAESGAKARVLRTLLGVKKAYTQAELQKPFVVVRYVFQAPANDPAVRQQLVTASIQSMTSVYGPMALPAPPAEVGIYEDSMDLNHMKNVTRTAEDEPDEPEPCPGPETGGPDPTTPPPLMWLDLEMWAAATTGEKILEVEKLAEFTGYDIRSFEKKAGYKIEKMPEAKLNSLWRNLVELKNQKEAA